MNVTTHETAKNALSIQFRALARQATLPALPVPSRCTALVKSIAPVLEAERKRAFLEAERRQKAEQARQEQQRRIREQQVSRRAMFRVD